LSAVVGLWVLGAVGCAQGGTGAVPGDDAPGDDADAAPADAAPAADAATDAPDPATVPAILAFEPAVLVVSHGKSVNATVTLDRAAPLGGQVVTLDSDAAGKLDVPGTVLVAPGQTSVTFAIGGVADGGPFTIDASIGEGTPTSIIARVVPALASFTPGSADLTVGGAGTYTLTLDAAAPVPLTVALSTSAAGIATVPATVLVPQGVTAVNVSVSGVGLGGPATITAALGGGQVAAGARVLGLYLSEVLFDVTSTDTGKEWVELYNASTVAIDVTGMRLRSANGASGYVDSLVLAGTVPAGGCVVVGGPMDSVGVTAVQYFQAADIAPDLGNASSGAADGLSLVTATGAIVDNVLYGTSNGDKLTDENGVDPAGADVGIAPANQTIERTAPGLAGPWQIQATPSPGNCTPISS
jgi:hypothetical protein